MARREDVIVSDWIRATSDGNIALPGAPETILLTISADKPETAKFEDGKSQRVIRFVELPGKKLGLNATNWDTIAAISGQPDDENWAGTKVELLAVPQTKSPTGHAIRIRKPRVGGPVIPPLGAETAAKVDAKLVELKKSPSDLRSYLRLVGAEPARLIDGDLAAWPTTWIGNVKTYLTAPDAALAAVRALNDDIPF